MIIFMVLLVLQEFKSVVGIPSARRTEAKERK